MAARLETTPNPSLPTHKSIPNATNPTPPPPSSTQIKRAYRSLALKHHPDLASGDDAHNANEKFAAINTAYEVLGDERARKRYEYIVEHERTLVYDEQRDWTLIDYKVGNPLTPNAEARAAQQAQRAEFEAELKRRVAVRDAWDSFAIQLICVAALAVAVVWFALTAYKRHAKAKAERERKQKLAHRLKSDASAIEAEKQRILDELLAQAAEADLDKEDRAAPSNDAQNENLDDAVAAADEAPLAHDSDDEHAARKHGGGAVFKCDVCRKRYKSEGQLDDHMQSKAHLKAVKDAKKAK